MTLESGSHSILLVEDSEDDVLLVQYFLSEVGKMGPHPLPPPPAPDQASGTRPAAGLMHKTSAWPLAGAYVVLVVYASLYPFSGWRNQEIPPWEFLFAGWPRYWTGFDLAANVVGYVPLGLRALREGRSP